MLTLADYPHLVAQLDAKKNGSIAPETITRTSHRLWWRCPAGPDHRWAARVADRVRGQGCPFCAGNAVSVTNALSKVAPALARQWHPTKNGALGAGDVTVGASKRVWWKCPAGPDHEWNCTVSNRDMGRGCPFCANRRISKTNSLAVVCPKIAREWHPTKNGALTPRDVTRGASHRVWWRCAFGHEWNVAVCGRTNKGTGCPHCHRLRRKQPVATTGTRQKPVRFAAYEGARHGPVRRVR